MDVCSKNHDEIVHDCGICPLCDAKEEIGRWEEADGEKDDEINALESRILLLEKEIEELKHVG